MQVILPNVAHVLLHGYNFLPFKKMADRGHKYIGEKKGRTLHLKNRKIQVLFFSSFWQTNASQELHDGGEFKGDFAKLCWRHKICQESSLPLTAQNSTG